MSGKDSDEYRKLMKELGPPPIKQCVWQHLHNAPIGTQGRTYTGYLTGCNVRIAHKDSLFEFCPYCGRKITE